jgi:scyllo-inositol 2-dehydrogenase (NADP+)
VDLNQIYVNVLLSRYYWIPLTTKNIRVYRRDGTACELFEDLLSERMNTTTLNGTVIRVGLVAFGLSGRVFHAPFIMTHPLFELVAVYERSKDEAAAFCADRHYASSTGPVQTVRSVEQLCSRADVDLVVVCSPIEFHYEHSKLALLAGKHVLVEKAFCSTGAQAKELVDLAQSLHLICVPYQNRQFDSDFMTLKKLLSTGALGDVVEYSGFYNRWSPNVREHVWKDTIPGSGGNFRSLGSHMIDQAVALFGVPERLWADIRCQREAGMLDDGKLIV